VNFDTHTHKTVNVFTQILFIQRLHHLFSPDKNQRPLHMWSKNNFVKVQII